jgi:6-phosphogluconolactonase
MDLIVAPIADLRPRLTHAFEEVVAATLDRDVGGARGAAGFACGVTGGSTALIFLGALREAQVDWSRITLYWGDERAVPPDHPDSNYGLAEQVLLQPLGGRAPNAVRMVGEAGDVHAAAAAYEKRLGADLGTDPLDLLILGTGDDGHICSLFPGHAALAVSDRRVIAIDDSPKPPPTRLTLTMPFVLASRHVWVVAVGERKRPVLQHAVDGREPQTPLDLVVGQARNLTIFTDLATL